VGSPSLLDWVVNWRQAPFHLAEATLGGGREGGGGGSVGTGRGGAYSKEVHRSPEVVPVRHLRRKTSIRGARCRHDSSFDR
jgi:hypothetical protein